MKIKRILRRIVFGIFVFLVLNILAVPVVYEIIFMNPHSYSVDTTPGIYNYQEYSEKYPREEITYPLGNYELMGYSYILPDSDYLVVTVHGIKDNADTLLAEDFYFLDHGYSVFSFDMSGCGKSGGHINGFSQGFIDLEYTLKFLNSDSRFSGFKKLLFGFSEGGYSVASVLSKTTENVYGVVSVSGYNNAATLIGDKGFSYAGPLVYIGKPIVRIVEQMKFHEYTSITAESAIRNTTIPVFLAHGLKDTTIPYKLSTLSKFENDDRVKSYSNSSTHSGILYSQEALEYQQMVKEELKKTKDKKAYISTVDDVKYSELNPYLFESVLDFFEDCRK